MHTATNLRQMRLCRDRYIHKGNIYNGTASADSLSLWRGCAANGLGSMQGKDDTFAACTNLMQTILDGWRWRNSSLSQRAPRSNLIHLPIKKFSLKRPGGASRWCSGAHFNLNENSGVNLSKCVRNPQFQSLRISSKFIKWIQELWKSRMMMYLMVFAKSDL